MAMGRSRNIAENNAALISYNGVQKDSVLLMDKGIAINKTDKFRNQRVVLTIYVPAGKKIKIDKSVGWSNNVHIGNDWNNGDWYYDSEEDPNEWKSGVEYIMNADGRLYDLKGNLSSRSSNRTEVKINSNGVEVITNDGDDNYRYKNSEPEPVNKIDSLKMKLENEKQKIKDSLEKAKQKIEQQLQKIGENAEPAPLSAQLPAFNPMMSIN